MAKLCFGGSFNPIHAGHLLGCRQVMEVLKLEGVILIPSAQPPHKAGHHLVPANHRLKMCELSVEGVENFEVNDLELHRTGPSYTIDTARELKRRGMAEVHWLIGADMLASLPTWHEPLSLLREVTFWIIKRPGWSINWDTLPPEYRHLQHNVVATSSLDLSATTIRGRVAAGLPIDWLTPPAVVRYICENGLYRSANP